MRTILLDLANDPLWQTPGWSQRVARVDLSSIPLTCTPSNPVSLIVDARGRHDEGLVLLKRMASVGSVECLFVTDREAPNDHRETYLAGATRICVLRLGEALPAELLGGDE